MLLEQLHDGGVARCVPVLVLACGDPGALHHVGDFRLPVSQQGMDLGTDAIAGAMGVGAGNLGPFAHVVVFVEYVLAAIPGIISAEIGAYLSRRKKMAG